MGSENWSSTKATTAKPPMSAERLEMDLSCSDFSSTSRRFFSAWRSQTHRAFSRMRCSMSSRRHLRFSCRHRCSRCHQSRSSTRNSMSCARHSRSSPRHRRSSSRHVRVSEVSSAPRKVCRTAVTGSGDGSAEEGLGGTTSWGHRDAWELNFLSGLTTVRPRSSPKPDAEPTADCGLRSPVRPRTRARPRCCKASLQGQKRGPKVKLGTAKGSQRFPQSGGRKKNPPHQFYNNHLHTLRFSIWSSS